MNYIKKFQTDNNLVSDGIIGKNTLLKMKQVFNLSSDEATAHFVGQLSHETVGFTKDIENLNYSSERLLEVFKKYFPTKDIADQYARKPEKIGNRVYANRMGNGPEESGDGFKYRGRFSVHTTGLNNYTELSVGLNDPEIVTNPDNTLVKYFWKAGLFFFYRNNLFSITKTVDYNSIRKLTKAINGGYNGLQERYDLTIKYYNILKKKKKVETQQKEDNDENNKNNEEQYSNISSDSDTYSGARDILVTEESSREGGISSSTGDKKTKDSPGLFSKIIRWILSKISGGYSDKKTT